MFRLASRPCPLPSDIESWRVIKPLPGARSSATKAAPAKAAQPVTGPTKAEAGHSTPE
jgi:hypothetical protein